MFVSTRRKTAGEHGSATILRPAKDTVQKLNHWAWTGWIPEEDQGSSQPEVQVPGHVPELIAA